MELTYKQIAIIVICAGLATLLFTHFISRRYEPQAVVTTRSVVALDTLIYRNIEPVTVTYIETLPEKDSLYTFRDTVEGRWSAEVTGQNVDLRSLVIVDRQETIHTTKLQRPKWEVAIKASINPYSQWVGVGVSRSVGRLTVSLDGGYDYIVKKPYVGVEASFAIWRE